MPDDARTDAAQVETEPPSPNGHGAAGRNGDAGENGHERRVSFSELVRIHFRWAKHADRGADTSPVAQRYAAALANFQRHEGEILDAYWCRKDASAVALTAKDRGWFRRGREYRLHRLTDWVTAGKGEIADLLHECDVLALKASESPLRIPKVVMLRWLLAVETHVLGFIERSAEPTQQEVAGFVARERRRLARIEAYYQEAGERWGRWWYVVGMLGGGGVLLLAAAVASAYALGYFGAFDPGAAATRYLYACTAAGGLGAFVSVLFRMAGKRGGFNIDHELGRFRVGLLGAYRPLLGAISGVLLYFLVQTPLLPIEDTHLKLPFYVVVAFLAGFSEAWTKVVLGGAMGTLAERPDEEEAADEAPAPDEGETALLSGDAASGARARLRSGA